MRYTWYARSALVALDHHIQGHATGLGEHFRAAFHPEGRVVSVRDGKLAMMAVEEFVEAETRYRSRE